MTKARLDGIYLLILGSAVLVLLGAALESASSFAMVDFKSLYYGTRCVVHQCDPFKESELLRVYRAERTVSPPETADVTRIATQFGNLPTVFTFVAPLALLPWGPAHVLWMFLTAGSIILAAFLMWSLGARFAPLIAGGLISFLVANTELLIVVGNAAGIVIGLCLVAAWCFLEERFVPAGILCMAASLAIKPHDAGLVWLFFLLAGGIYRRRALQSLLVAVVLNLPMALWVRHVAPNWMQELNSNLSGFSAPRDIADPGLASMGVHGLGMLINLQTAIYVFWKDPRVYNSIAYFIVGSLVLIWIVVTLRARISPSGAWLALAAIAALSMLPVYHRQYDAKLLLLTVPACAMLWAEGGPLKWIALALNSAGFVLTGDLTLAIFVALIGNLHLSTTGLTWQILTAMQVFSTPLVLLFMGIFYTWVYARRALMPTASMRSDAVAGNLSCAGGVD